MRYRVIEATPERRRYIFLRLGIGVFYAEPDGRLVLRHETSWRKIAGLWFNTPWGCYWLRVRRFGGRGGPL